MGIFERYMELPEWTASDVINMNLGRPPEKDLMATLQYRNDKYGSLTAGDILDSKVEHLERHQLNSLSGITAEAAQFIGKYHVTRDGETAEEAEITHLEIDGSRCLDEIYIARVRFIKTIDGQCTRGLISFTNNKYHIFGVFSDQKILSLEVPAEKRGVIDFLRLSGERKKVTSGFGYHGKEDDRPYETELLSKEIWLQKRSFNEFCYKLSNILTQTNRE